MKPSITPVDFTINSTSTAVEQLYAKFENLKQRISNTDSKRSSRSIDRRSFIEKEKDSKFKGIGNIQPLPLTLFMTDKNDKIKEGSESPRGQYFDTLKSSFVNEMQNIIKRMEQMHSKKIETIVKKLVILQRKLSGIQSNIKQKRQEQSHEKINSSFTENANNTTCCHTFKSLSQNTIPNHFLTNTNKLSSEELQQRHREQIRSIVENYEHKISSILEGQSDKSSGQRSFSNCQYFSLSGINESKKPQELLVTKEKEIKQLSSEVKKLKRMLDQTKLNFERNGELNKLLKEENRMLESTVQKLEAWKKQAQLQKRNQQFELEKLRSQLKLRNLEIIKLKEEIQNMKSLTQHLQKGQKKEKNSQPKLNEGQKDGHKKIKKRKSSELENLITDRSVVLEDRESIVQQNLDQNQDDFGLDSEEFQKLKRSHSQIMNRVTKNSISIIRREKQLLSQVFLLQQQNRLLKWKKDKFQSEVKRAQDDEDMMQQQLGRLNQEIRRLNSFWNNLDECGVKLLKGESLNEEKVKLLQNESKLKEEYLKQKEKKKRGFSLRK